MGAPSKFTEEIAAAICERISDGESLRSICTDSKMPGRATVRVWLSENVAFQARYARARVEQAHVYAERVVEAGESSTDAALGRLKMDALKWAASKLAPTVYGEKQHIEHSGSIDMRQQFLGME